ncbi:ribonuclease M5 [Thermoactinomyces mirandus]|uniref:Ribonuclease M5 n=1 Tax=Thermoactinomyces mirandus TaxID=2756294 RepID=A0A7W2AQ83_9BACL|nr:ribonuclease M5 [Thermoactinomyces mirandus]MBA4601238.1 ribonuclease M5 [Thermoactinomyces mirandus]
MRVNEVIVVEGKNDTIAIRKAVEADTIETRGSALEPHVLEEIKRAQQERGVIIFTDPDYVGERIREIIAREVPDAKHAFLTQTQAKGNHKIGIEHASSEDIIEALQSVRVAEAEEETVPPLTWEEYMELGLVGDRNSRNLRKQVSERLGIGYRNAKQFYRRLHVLRITREEIFRTLDYLRKGSMQ